MQTNEVRRVVEARLNSIKTKYNISEVSHRLASEDAMFPHVVWEINGIRPMDHGRQDYELDVHIWTKNDAYTAYEIADAVVLLFRFANLPQDDILPTFYESSALVVEDTDKSLVHMVVRLEGHTYDTSEGGFEWQT